MPQDNNDVARLKNVSFYFKFYIRKRKNVHGQFQTNSYPFSMDVALQSSITNLFISGFYSDFALSTYI